jgi:hypothetical protein
MQSNDAVGVNDELAPSEPTSPLRVAADREAG